MLNNSQMVYFVNIFKTNFLTGFAQIFRICSKILHKNCDKNAPGGIQETI